MGISEINGGTSAYGYTKIDAKTDNSKMTMSEYKSYIYGKISDMRQNGSVGGNYMDVDISDEGFKAMKENPEYEKHVMEQLKNAFDTSAFSGDESYTIYHIGKNRNEIYCEKQKVEKLSKKQLEEKREQSEQNKRRIKKQQEAKMQHYAEYKKMLMENSLRKAEIELDHIKGEYDNRKSNTNNMNAISSYRAVMDGKSDI
ncbi:MAG: hypothetical protein NC320_12590 [Clostridium sp.]|nr:hypothetical protein [Clostridium sp.]MCM1548275.1 hypothetical protein [Ruminococcus sp.]